MPNTNNDEAPQPQGPVKRSMIRNPNAKLANMLVPHQTLSYREWVVRFGGEVALTSVSAAEKAEKSAQRYIDTTGTHTWGQPYKDQSQNEGGED